MDLATAGAMLAKPVLTEVMKQGASRVLTKLLDARKKKQSVDEIAQVVADFLKEFEHHMRQIRLVKTIQRHASPVDLMDFYYPLALEVPGTQRNNRFHAHSFSTIHSARTVIIGTAGQGKSTLMRYLASKILSEKDSIPIFFELKNFTKGLSIPALISQSLHLPYQIGESALRHLEKTKGITLFLDGADEIEGDDLKAFFIALEWFADAYEIPILISSRPDAALEHLDQFHNLYMSPFTKTESSECIRKVSRDGTLAETLMDKVRNHAGNILELINTPLLVTLLVVVYEVTQSIPEQLSDFYDALIDCLLRTHDATKGGVERVRKSQLTDGQIKRLFEGVCFKTLGSTRIEYEKIQRAVQSTAADQKIQVIPDTYLEDVRSITALLLHEGKAWFFVHKSVQEFFAARFLTHLPDERLMEFGGKMRNIERRLRLSQVLEFLAEIDRVRYLQCIERPYLQFIVGERGPSSAALSLKDLARLIPSGITPQFHARRNSAGIETEDGTLTFQSILDRQVISLSLQDDELRDLDKALAVVHSVARVTMRGLIDVSELNAYPRLKRVVEDWALEELKAYADKLAQVDAELRECSIASDSEYFDFLQDI